MTSIRTFSTLVLCLYAGFVGAQTAPPPPTPYPTPVTGYVGRYLDSSTTPQIQYVVARTFRAEKVKAAPERDMLYMIIGSTFVGQTLSTYADRVAAGPLVTLPRGGFFGPGEKYLPFQKWVDADRSPGWSTVFQDGQDRLFDFDWDDRGYTYLAYSIYGFGIIDANFQKVSQLIYPNIDISPLNVVVFRNGASYYALLGDGSTQARLYDVTTPAAPVLLGSSTIPFRDAAKTTDGHIAFVTFSNQLQIHTPATIVANAPAIYTSAATGPFRQVATDGTNFYALGNSGREIHVLQPSGGTYTDTVTPSFNNLQNQLIEYGAGYLTVSGSSTFRLAIYRVDGTTLTLLEDGQYLFDWMASLSAHPYRIPRMLLPLFDGSRTLLIAALFGLGEVFTMTSQPPLTVTAQFSPATIVPGSTSLLTLTITNPNPVPVSFSLDEAYPANVVNTGDGLQTTCGIGALSAPAQGGSFLLSNATVGAAATCTVTVELTSSVPGTHTITLPPGSIASADNSNTAEASAALIVDPLDAPQVTKAFSPTTAPPGVPARMTITLTNPNALPITGVAFTDNYPATLINATPVNALNTCGGTLLAANGGTSLSLSGGTIPASLSCTVAVDVMVTQRGSVTNTIAAGSVTSDNADPNAVAAIAVFDAAPAVAIPTLSEWAVLVMMSLLGLGALLRLRA